MDNHFCRLFNVHTSITCETEYIPFSLTWLFKVEQRRWRVDINSALLANLALANVKLPGGELRRKSEDDERAMRSFMKV